MVGASQGLGEALALQLAAAGAVVVLSARRADALARVAAACSAAGAPRCAVVPLDLRGGAQAHADAAAAAAAAAGADGVAYLFLAAGGTQRAAAEDTAAEVDADMFALNATSLLSLTKAALPSLLAAAPRGGARVVVLSSAAGRLPSPGQATYAATKHALNGFFASLRAELSSRGVGVTLLCPGPTATGQPGQPRVTFGATLRGSVLSEAAQGGAAHADAAAAAAAATTSAAEARARLAAPRCAQLALAAAAHGVREAWLARHPVLLLLYLGAYTPSLAAAIVDRVGPKRVAAARAGGNMYSAR